MIVRLMAAEHKWSCGIEQGDTVLHSKAVLEDRAWATALLRKTVPPVREESLGRPALDELEMLRCAQHDRASEKSREVHP